MGVFIDYAYHIECSEAELLKRLTRLRGKLCKLPFDSVSEVLPVDPAYHSLILKLLPEHGYPLPPAVQSRVEGKLRTSHDELCFWAAPPIFMLVPPELEKRFYQPAEAFAKKTKLWREEDLPKEISFPHSFTYFRQAFVLELAGVMLRHGYLIMVQPCEGCESFAIGLTSHRTKGTPIWLGSGFTKTQYATRFVEVHESICKALDLVREEGLLLAGRDNSGFFEHRDWSQSAPIVNAETTFAQLMGGLLRGGFQEAQKQGIMIEDLSDPATKNYNIVRVKKEEK